MCVLIGFTYIRNGVHTQQAQVSHHILLLFADLRM